MEYVDCSAQMSNQLLVLTNLPQVLLMDAPRHIMLPDPCVFGTNSGVSLPETLLVPTRIWTENTLQGRSSCDALCFYNLS